LIHFSSVLSKEEPGITVVTVRPGIVDTTMQARLREQAPQVMPPDQAAYYSEIKEKGELEPPEVPARSLAWLVLYAPEEWSGDFLDYDDPRIVRNWTVSAK
jgi:NAD(P)-dependent dehydrogenase (short-subunit alcohol dehydrogenase family)